MWCRSGLPSLPTAGILRALSCLRWQVIFTSGQKRRMTPAVKHEMKRRAAVEPVIGHIKNDHRMDRNYLAGTQGEAINVILAAAGYNFSLLPKWLRLLLHLLLALLLVPRKHQYA
jgi:transposase, IS5 family